jgi:hypothetical protein
MPLGEPFAVDPHRDAGPASRGEFAEWTHAHDVSSAVCSTTQEDWMSKVKVSITTSLDGFVAGPNPSEKDPLGVGEMQLHQWLLALKAFRETHGEHGGEVNASTPFAEEILGEVGATIMGRNMFCGGPEPWVDDAWKGFVTHIRYAREDR